MFQLILQTAPDTTFSQILEFKNVTERSAIANLCASELTI